MAALWRFSFPRLKHVAPVGLNGLLETELDAIMKDPSRPSDLRLDAYEEMLRREKAMCRCICDPFGGGMCDFHMDNVWPERPDVSSGGAS